MTAQGWIDETRDMLLSGYVEELLLLASDATSSATTLSVTGAASSGITAGVVIEINTEAMYVKLFLWVFLGLCNSYNSYTRILPVEE